MDLDPVEAKFAYPHTLGPHMKGLRTTGAKWVAHPHLAYVSRKIAVAIARGNGRLILCWPPGYGKTQLVANVVPPWFFRLWPDKRMLLVMNSSANAEREGGTARDVINANPWLGVTMSDSFKGRGLWDTQFGGGMASLGMSGSVLSKRGDVIIADDLYPNFAKAQSPSYREKVWEFWHSTLGSRLKEGGTVIMNQQRLHYDDVCGRLVREYPGEWEMIRLPELCDDANDPLGRKIGEPLCPALYSMATCQDNRKKPAPIYLPMYAQAPKRAGAGAVYDHWSDDNAGDCGYVPSLPLQVSIDFNVNPGMHMLLGHHDPMTDQAWDFDEIHEMGMALDAALAELERRVNALPKRPTEIEVYGDASGKAREIGDGVPLYDKIARCLERLKIRHRMLNPPANPPVLERIIAVNDRLRNELGEVRYRCGPRCVRLRADFENLRKGADGLPDKSDRLLSHASDALGYRLWDLERSGVLRSLRPGRAAYAR